MATNSSSTTPSDDEVAGVQPGTQTRRTIVKGAAWSIPIIATAVAVPGAAASPVPPPPSGTAAAKPGGAWNIGSYTPATGTRASALQINAPVDTSKCVGTPVGTVLSITARFTNGSVTQTSGFATVKFVASAAQPSGGNSPAFGGTFTVAAYPGGTLLSLTIIVLWTGGCGQGVTQTLTWATTPITPTVLFSGAFAA